MVSIGLVLSEEKIFEKVYDVRRTDDDDGRQVMAIAHLTLWVRWAKNENELERESENDEEDKSREKIKTVESEKSEEETLRAITEYEIEYEFN